MQGYSLENSVAMICGGASALTGVVCLLSLLSLLSARSGSAGAERAAAFALTLVALGLGLAAFWSALGGPAASGGALAQISSLSTRFLTTLGIPVAVFQIQASVAAVIVAVLAWRFPHR